MICSFMFVLGLKSSALLPTLNMGLARKSVGNYGQSLTSSYFDISLLADFLLIFPTLLHERNGRIRNDKRHVLSLVIVIILKWFVSY